MPTVERVLSEARKLIGTVKKDSSHKKIVQDYNTIRPLPRSYAANYEDEWCDITISVIFKRAGALHLIGAECGVDEHIKIFKAKGIWFENGNMTPRPGDIITWSWRVNSQPNDAWGDHIGLVESVRNGVITTIEGNSANMVKRNTYPVGHGNIRGYARPRYEAAGRGTASNGSDQNQYIVVAGDSLWKISKQFGMTVQELCNLNGLTSSSIIHPGQRLKVKRTSSETAGQVNSGVSPTPSAGETLIRRYSESGKFIANTTLNIRSSHYTTASKVATLFPGESIIYDSVYITNKYVWVSYISYSGQRRFVTVRTYQKGQRGPLFGKII